MLLPIVKEATEKAGGVQKLAEALSIKRQAFYMWKKVPSERVIQIEIATGIPRQRLRPDLYPPQSGEAA
jgi:DNA-binding transcriptional regulator YdaS (Cro superfamily)